MSIKNNTFIAAAAAALGVVVAADVGHVCEGLLSDYAVTGFGFAEVDAKGRTLAICTVDTGDGPKVRVVADTSGSARLYPTADAAIAIAKKASMAADTAIQFRRFIPVGTVGDPVAALKSKYKAAKSEVSASVKALDKLTAKVTAAEALGWDTADGTPEGLEYEDMTARVAAITEWRDKITTKRDALAASLTAAGVDPVTVV